jgi:hypothetical protein
MAIARTGPAQDIHRSAASFDGAFAQVISINPKGLFMIEQS